MCIPRHVHAPPLVCSHLLSSLCSHWAPGTHHHPSQPGSSSPSAASLAPSSPFLPSFCFQGSVFLASIRFRVRALREKIPVKTLSLQLGSKIDKSLGRGAEGLLWANQNLGSGDADADGDGDGAGAGAEGQARAYRSQKRAASPPQRTTFQRPTSPSPPNTIQTSGPAQPGSEESATVRASHSESLAEYSGAGGQESTNSKQRKAVARWEAGASEANSPGFKF